MNLADNDVAGSTGFRASFGFSGTQGTNQWTYQMLNVATSAFTNLSFDTADGRWENPANAAPNLPHVSAAAQHPDNGFDSVRR